jgi:hypothetical protein
MIGGCGSRPGETQLGCDGSVPCRSGPSFQSLRQVARPAAGNRFSPTETACGDGGQPGKGNLREPRLRWVCGRLSGQPRSSPNPSGDGGGNLDRRTDLREPRLGRVCRRLSGQLCFSPYPSGDGGGDLDQRMELRLHPRPVGLGFENAVLAPWRRSKGPTADRVHQQCRCAAEGFVVFLRGGRLVF